MPEDVIIVGATMLVVEGVKTVAKKIGVKDETIKQVVTPAAVFLVAGGLSVAAAAVWVPDLAWREALRQGLTLGAVSGGLYGLGKAALGRS